MNRDKLVEISGELEEMEYLLQSAKAISMWLEQYGGGSNADALDDMIGDYQRQHEEIDQQIEEHDEKELIWANRAYEKAVS